MERDVWRKSCTSVRVVETPTEMLFEIEYPAVTATVVASPTPWRTEDIGTSQFRKVVAGSIVNIVSFEQRAETVRDERVWLGCKVTFVALADVGVEDVRLKTGLDSLARRAYEDLFITSMRPFAPQTMMSFSVRVRCWRGGWNAAAVTTLRVAKWERRLDVCMVKKKSY
jgi:hypothetical protein